MATSRPADMKYSLIFCTSLHICTSLTTYAILWGISINFWFMTYLLYWYAWNYHDIGKTKYAQFQKRAALIWHFRFNCAFCSLLIHLDLLFCQITFKSNPCVEYYNFVFSTFNEQQEHYNFIIFFQDFWLKDED